MQGFRVPSWAHSMSGETGGSRFLAKLAVLGELFDDGIGRSSCCFVQAADVSAGLALDPHWVCLAMSGRVCTATTEVLGDRARTIPGSL